MSPLSPRTRLAADGLWSSPAASGRKPLGWFLMAALAALVSLSLGALALPAGDALSPSAAERGFAVSAAFAVAPFFLFALYRRAALAQALVDAGHRPRAAALLASGALSLGPALPLSLRPGDGPLAAAFFVVASAFSLASLALVRAHPAARPELAAQITHEYRAAGYRDALACRVRIDRRGALAAFDRRTLRSPLVLAFGLLIASPFACAVWKLGLFSPPLSALGLPLCLHVLWQTASAELTAQRGWGPRREAGLFLATGLAPAWLWAAHASPVAAACQLVALGAAAPLSLYFDRASSHALPRPGPSPR